MRDFDDALPELIFQTTGINDVRQDRETDIVALRYIGEQLYEIYNMIPAGSPLHEILLDFDDMNTVINFLNCILVDHCNMEMNGHLVLINWVNRL